jgi:YD repeat-containing protein
LISIVCASFYFVPPIGAKPGIKEEIPAKYQAAYLNWKNEFLVTEMGRRQWETIDSSPEFSLKIELTRDNPRGASTGNYEWNDQGKLIAATITLGSRLSEGYPNPIYYPVMNSLSLPDSSAYQISAQLLAATKLAHEFGHLLNTLKADASRYKRQSLLIPQYNKIFLSNGRNTEDPRLKELALQIGGTPVEIWEDREYWGEANAMLYLQEKLLNTGLRCTVFNQIKRSVDLYASNYTDRFLQVAKNGCGWN